LYHLSSVPSLFLTFLNVRRMFSVKFGERKSAVLNDTARPRGLLLRRLPQTCG